MPPPGRRVRGDRQFRKLLQRMPEAAREEIGDMMEDTGRRLLANMRADVPTASGRLKAGLSMRLLRRSMRLRVGFIGAAVNRRLPYRNVAEFGQNAKTVQAIRRNPSGRVSRYALRLPRRRGASFVHSARNKALMREMGGRIRTFWQRTLERAAQGITDE